MIKQSKLEIIYGKESAQKIVSSNVLVVGAGGIGCELMKTLSLTGFTKISVIDLDTIDVSNLNRQFLFRREHVDKSKSQVVKEQILKFLCGKNISKITKIALNDIQEDRFGFKFFSQFDVVINALDNEEARKHVNNLCFNLNIPLIDSGTNGYNATCISICKEKTPCYQCVSRKTDQTFPVCTIRQKPEKLIHCIVWAKALFEGLFGPKEQTNNIIDDIVKELDEASQTLDPFQFACILFDRIFNKEPSTLQQNLQMSLQRQNIDDSEKQATIEFVGKIKTLSIDNYKQQIELDLQNQYYTLNQPKNDQENNINILNLKDYINMFIKSILTFYNNRSQELGTLIFNKDDDNIVDFVSSATNIRAFNFSIPMESKFKIKEIAGKIIPAISSSNALVAALQVLEAIKVLNQKYDQLQGIVYNRLSQNRIQSFKRINDVPNSDCEICSDDSKSLYYIEIKNFKDFTFEELINQAIIKEIGLNKNILVEFNSNIIYEFGIFTHFAQLQLDVEMDEDEIDIYQKKFKKKLSELQIKDQSILQVQGQLNEDNEQSNVYIQIIENPSSEQNFKLNLLKKGQKKQKQMKEQQEEQKVSDQNQDVLEIKSDEDQDELTIQDDKIESQQLGKRKSQIELNNDSPQKRSKQ